MFAAHLYKRLINYIDTEIRIYKLEKRITNLLVRRPFSIVNPSRIQIGENVIIQRNCFFHCGGFSWSEGKGGITIGDNCLFSENNILYGAGEIEIGNNTHTGPGVMIFSSRDDYSLDKSKNPVIQHHFDKVVIESYVKLFTNVIVTPGVIVGEGAVVGAGSIVTDDVPPWTISLGNPARVILKRGKDNYQAQKMRRIRKRKQK